MHFTIAFWIFLERTSGDIHSAHSFTLGDVFSVKTLAVNHNSAWWGEIKKSLDLFAYDWDTLDGALVPSDIDPDPHV